MSSSDIRYFTDEERSLYACISRNDGIKARDIASRLHLERSRVNHLLFSSALMRELCFQDRAYGWHALVRQARPHEGLFEFSGWYGSVREFLAEQDDEWFSSLQKGCRRIGRSLNDTRGLFHSFIDCRKTMISLFRDLSDLSGLTFDSWELVFEFRLNRSKMIRIYADVLLITEHHVFSFEFKMKNSPESDEVIQAAKYCPYLEVVFGNGYEVIPALVLTGASDMFEFVKISGTDAGLWVSSGDMLFNVLNEYMDFLN